MMNKKYIFSTTLLIGLLILLLLNSNKIETINLKKEVPLSKNITPYTISLIDKETSQIKKNIPDTHIDTQVKTIPNKDKQTIYLQEINIYDSISMEEAQLTIKPRKYIQSVGAIHLNNTHLTSLKYNDTFVLTDIEGIDYTMTVADIQKHNDESITTTGIYHDEGITYTTTITHTDQESFITLSTPQGIYEIETKDGIGYIYRSDAIRRQMHDSTKKDVIVLPIPKAPIPL